MAEPNTPSPTRLPVQFLMVVATLIVWAISPKPELWSLIAAYLFVWLAFNLFAKSRSSIEIPWPRRTVIAVVILILAVPLATLFRFRFDFESAEGFYAFSDLHADRSRLQDLPTISPPTIHYDHPQSHYIYAPETSAVSLDLGSGVVRLSAENLGHGLFRTRYDPRKHGIPQTAMAKIEVRLVADGVAFPRTLDAVRFEAHPRWLSASPERGLAAAVSEETDEIIVISRKGRYRRLPTEDGPSDSTFFANGTRLAIAHRYSPTLQVIEPATGEEIASAEVALFQHRVAAHPHGNRLAVAIAGLEPEIRFLRADSLATEVSVPLPFRPDWMTFGESESSLILSSSENGALYRLSKCGDGWELSEPMSIGSPPVTIARSADGDLIYVAVTDYRPEGAPRGGNHFVDDQILVVDSATLEIVGRRSTGGRDASQDSPGGTNRGVSPLGMAARPGGSLLVAFAGSDEVWETDLFDRIPPIKWSGAEFGLAVPVGIADLGDGSFAVSSPAQGVIAIYSGDGKRRHFLAFAPSDSDLAAHPEGSLGQTSLNIRWGERASYESTRSGIACQSCHLHGGTDHAFHDIGQGNSPLTLTTRGIAEKGADPNTPYVDDKGQEHNLLFDSIMVENIKFAKALLENGADIYYKDEKSVTTLLQACHRGLVDIAKMLLERNAAETDTSKSGSFIDDASEEGIRPLIAAASEGHLDVVKLLIEHKADINVKDQDETTALMAASARGHVEVVKELINAGASINEQNRDGHTALMFAYNGKNQVETLWERFTQFESSKSQGGDKAKADGGTGPIIREALDNHTALVDFLMKSGADTKLKDKEGHTAKDFDYHPDTDAEILEKEAKKEALKDESKEEL